MKVGNDQISLTFALDSGVLLVGIRDESQGHEYLPSPGSIPLRR